LFASYADAGASQIQSSHAATPATSVIIPFTIIGAEDGFIPDPVRELRDLMAAGRAPLLVRYWGRWPADCELVVTAAVLDLAAADSRSEWRHLAGQARFGWHQWLEAGAWAVDLSNGCEKSVVVAERAVFYDLVGLLRPMLCNHAGGHARVEAFHAPG
jgi:hypothetical protein